MNSRPPLKFALISLALASCTALSAASLLAQSPPREKPKLKDFGSSLKRLKWDPERNATVEKKRKPDKAKGSEEDDVVRVETSLVVCDVMIIDQMGHPVQRLTTKDFVLAEDGQPQQVGMFSLGDGSKVPRSIVLLIDYSSSLSRFINTSVEAAKTLVDKLGPLDTMAIVTDDVKLLQDFTRDKRKLKEKLESLRPDLAAAGRGEKQFGRSFQYSALMAILKEAFDEEDLRPIIIFQTDGDEVFVLRDPIIIPHIVPNLPADMKKEVEKKQQSWEQMRRSMNREFSLADVYRAAEKSQATIYTIFPGFRLLGLSTEDKVKEYKAQSERVLREWPDAYYASKSKRQLEDQLARTPPEAWTYYAQVASQVQSALAEVATRTGGWTAFLEKPSQADQIYSSIFSDINSRYIVGYYSTNKEHDGKRRTVKIEVRDHPEYKVVGRKSYYAPDPD